MVIEVGVGLRKFSPGCYLFTVSNSSLLYRQGWSSHQLPTLSSS